VHLLKRGTQLKHQKHPVSRTQHPPRKYAEDDPVAIILTINFIGHSIPLGLGLTIFVVLVEESVVERLQVSILGAVEDNDETVPVGGGGGVDGDDVLVLAEEQALELVVSVLPHLGVHLLFDECLSDYLVLQRVDHALLVLEDSLDDKMFVNEEHVSESSLSSFAQA